MTLSVATTEDLLTLAARVAALEQQLAYQRDEAAVTWLTTEQARAYLKVSRPTLRKLARGGKITSTTAGSHNRYSLPSMTNYLRSRALTEENITKRTHSLP